MMRNEGGMNGYISVSTLMMQRYNNNNNNNNTYIYHLLINVLSAHEIHIKLNTTLQTCVEHSPTNAVSSNFCCTPSQPMRLCYVWENLLMQVT